VKNSRITKNGKLVVDITLNPKNRTIVIEYGDAFFATEQEKLGEYGIGGAYTHNLNHIIERIEWCIHKSFGKDINDPYGRNESKDEHQRFEGIVPFSFQAERLESCDPFNVSGEEGK